MCACMVFRFRFVHRNMIATRPRIATTPTIPPTIAGVLLVAEEEDVDEESVDEEGTDEEGADEEGADEEDAEEEDEEEDEEELLLGVGAREDSTRPIIF